jgi:PQQ-dependent dehydrogenase (s-GDH family)
MIPGVLVALGLLGGCAPADEPEEGGARTATFESRIVATDFESPWEVVWGPDQHLWITERVGKRVTRIDPSDGSRQVAATIEEAYQEGGQDGVLGLALHPELLRNTGNDYVYVGLVYDADPGPDVQTRGTIRRYTYLAETGRLQDAVSIIEGLPAGNDHIAGRLAFGPDGKLYYTVGDQGANWLGNYCNPNRAQELPRADDIAARNWSEYQGKILRLNLDGSIPDDNPLLDGVRSHVYSYGHRNPQGLAFGADGTLYAAEHGPSTDDEVNRIRPGGNYGWPYVAGYRDDQAYVYANWSASEGIPCRDLPFSAQTIPASVPTQAETEWSHPDFVPPMQTFFTVPDDYDFRSGPGATVAASDLEIYLSDGIPEWRNSLLLTSLTRGVVYRMKLSEDGSAVDDTVFEEFRTTNRYRDITIDPRGRTFYVITDSTGRTRDVSGAFTGRLENPGALLEFLYSID